MRNWFECRSVLSKLPVTSQRLFGLIATALTGPLCPWMVTGFDSNGDGAERPKFTKFNNENLEKQILSVTDLAKPRRSVGSVSCEQRGSCSNRRKIK
jgi:hypothetical protein